MTSQADLGRLQKKIWDGSIPLEIRLASSECRTFDQSDAYMIQYPRLSYLPFLLARLHAFFSSFLINPDVSPSDGWLSYEDVPLKWHYPLGLLYDLYSGAEPNHAQRSSNITDPTPELLTEEAEDTECRPGQLPWRLTLHFTDWPSDQLIPLDAERKFQQDTFMHSVKEAGFLRYGSAKVVTSLSKDDSTQLWNSVETHNLYMFNTINQKLINPPGFGMKHVPMKIYLPSTAPTTVSDNNIAGSLRIVQAPVSPNLSSRQTQTVGTALHSLIPSLFPSRRSPLLAQAILHGAVLPLGTPLEELSKVAAYADGFLHFTVCMMG
ncbi:autophagy protein-like protein 5 [Patellaria atrata CBS 101060]|uniref:Autophagy protein 5 n=1 Tax=Patellaria atrata CBS 101060 TaxID=1346257 RepID=A0A9P4VWN0_9PEZI|nr:autophagy protein-like protein 5 [Patellaria atrata CBS 101060]